jgi:sporulation protein YlmC with PRC-barrel domain
MAEATQFTIGADVSCTDGACGEVRRVVVDPVARVVTHLVVEPKHRHGHGRLVPLDLVDTAAGEIRLHCTKAEFDKLDPAQETQLLPVSGDQGYGYDAEEVLSWPYYSLGGAGGGLLGGAWAGGLGSGPGSGLGAVGSRKARYTVTEDSVPLGEVEVQRGDRVHATDGEIGRVQGLVIDPGSHHVTHVLLQEGHLWGSKEVAIPIGAVTDVEAGIRLNITKQQVEDLPPVDTDHPSE